MNLIPEGPIQAPVSELVWKTEKTEWGKLVQITDGYVVHARGFTIGKDIWLDGYAVRVDHSTLWDTVMSEHYEDIKWSGSGRGTFPDYRGLQSLYWSITGLGSFLMQAPKLTDIKPEAVARLSMLLDELKTPEDADINWYIDETDSVRVTKSRLPEVVIDA